MTFRGVLGCWLLVVAGSAFADAAPRLVAYHEADCHPDAPVRYLGVGPAGFSFASSGSSDAKTERVSGYTKANGTVVDSYMRRRGD